MTSRRKYGLAFRQPIGEKLPSYSGSSKYKFNSAQGLGWDGELSTLMQHRSMHKHVVYFPCDSSGARLNLDVTLAGSNTFRGVRTGAPRNPRAEPKPNPSEPSLNRTSVTLIPVLRDSAMRSPIFLIVVSRACACA